MNEFLDIDEVQRLTGYKKPACQRRHLAAQGIPFDVDKDGRPVVRRNRTITPGTSRQEQPRWDAA